MRKHIKMRHDLPNGTRSLRTGKSNWLINVIRTISLIFISANTNNFWLKDLNAKAALIYCNTLLLLSFLITFCSLPFISYRERRRSGTSTNKTGNVELRNCELIWINCEFAGGNFFVCCRSVQHRNISVKQPAEWRKRKYLTAICNTFTQFGEITACNWRINWQNSLCRQVSFYREIFFGLEYSWNSYWKQTN